MRCYKCNAELSKDNVCPQCGADVSLYKKAIRISNAYYNRGLVKAGIKDLSGAVCSLKMSIAINKNNIDARNLLGLVYSQMGEVVEALSQWVISKSLQPDNNPAADYIEKIQSNQNKFEQVTNAIRKYNLSLNYAKEGNYDMAMIQLKKVVTVSPDFIKANQLLALLYIKNNEYGRARKLLNAVLKQDTNNTLAKMYIAELDRMTMAKRKQAETGSFLPAKKNKIVSNKPLNGNDVIIPKSTYKEPSNGAITIINVLAGVVIGAALIWFLITPARYKGLTYDYNKSIKEYSEQLSGSNAELNSLTEQLNTIKTEKEELESRLSQISGEGGNNKLLTAVINAANLYIANDKTNAAVELIDLDVSSLPTDEAKNLYNTISGATMTEASADLYNKGRTAYRKGDYTGAADYFVKAYKCNSSNADAIYYAAKSYAGNNSVAEAKQYFQIIVDEFVTSGYYNEAKTYVETH